MGGAKTNLSWFRELLNRFNGCLWSKEQASSFVRAK